MVLDLAPNPLNHWLRDESVDRCKPMENLDPWKLADELNVFQISALLAGLSPANFEYNSHRTGYSEAVQGYIVSIKNAVVKEKITALLIYNYSENDEYKSLDWDNTLIDLESLRSWLRQRGVGECFFFTDHVEIDTGVTHKGGFYAPKLAAAIGAWTEVTSNTALLNGKTPKQALQIWLRQHANEYGLTKDDGKPNEQGIEEICKVANWRPSGGASPTPTLQAEPPPGLPTRGGRVPLRLPTPPPPSDIDDEIPF